MSISDPIADMLTRIRNACTARKPSVSMPSSRLKVAIAEVMLKNGYIGGHEVEGEIKKTLTIALKYMGDEPVIEGLKRISKPSRRAYVESAKTPRVQGGLGIAIISTSQGLVTDRMARKSNSGGEVLCYVW